MSNTRDDFSAKVKRVLADRAGHRCSFCKRSTVGPSDESLTAVMSIGVAAHITAAAPGLGARRYNPSLTPEQRSSSANGIWLCQACGVIIDRDAVRFTSEALHLMKQEHTQFARPDTPVARDVAIISVGPRIIAAGQVVRFGPQGASVRLAYFLEGSAADLIAFAHEFDKIQVLERHVVVSEAGYGGHLRNHR